MRLYLFDYQRIDLLFVSIVKTDFWIQIRHGNSLKTLFFDDFSRKKP